MAGILAVHRSAVVRVDGSTVALPLDDTILWPTAASGLDSSMCRRPRLVWVLHVLFQRRSANGDTGVSPVLDSPGRVRNHSQFHLSFDDDAA